MKRFRIVLKLRNNLRNFNKEAAIDSMKNVLAVLGLGLLIGDFSTMNPLYVVPGAVLLLAVWYGDYLRHDLPSSSYDVKAGENVAEKERTVINPIEQLERAS